MRRPITLAICAALLSSSIAQAATLGIANGQILVDNGGGFQPASAGMTLKPGDRVMAKADGKGSIAYEGCAVEVAAGSVVTVQQTTPCMTTGSTAAPAAAAGGISTGGLILGGVIVAGGIAAAAAAGGKSSSPSSP